MKKSFIILSWSEGLLQDFGRAKIETGKKRPKWIESFRFLIVRMKNKLSYCKEGKGGFQLLTRVHVQDQRTVVVDLVSIYC